MENPHAQDDPRSPKRHTLAPAQTPRDAASRAVAALDAALWTTIVEFLPMPKDLELVDGSHSWESQKKYNKTKVAEVVATWQTLLNLRFVSRELAATLHPVDNKTLWKRLVLQNFDFSVGGTPFNLENYQDEPRLLDPDEDYESEEDSAASEEEEDDEMESHERRRAKLKKTPKVTTTEVNPQLVAMRGRYYDMPRGYLEEDVQTWCNLGIYHQPSQYGFLTTLQQKQQPPEGVWPESEDPFTLFGDLVRLLKLPHGLNFEDAGEVADQLSKYLAAPAEASSSSAFYGFYVMKTLGYVPHFWHWGRGIGGEWKGFTEPKKLEAAIAKQLIDDRGNDASGASFEDSKKYFNFPNGSVAAVKELYEGIRRSCRDWRSACCNSGSDGETPLFFVGESKAFPHRWIGYLGYKCWT